MNRIGSLLVVLLVVASSAMGQSLDVFGYFQANYTLYSPTVTPSLGTPGAYKRAQNSFSLQQLNLFFSKDFGSGFNAFVNLEVTNSFSTERNWGQFSLEEAWVRYSWGDALNIRTGLLIPAFNNMNEIKNKTPLLPYVYRPLVYETALSGILTFSDYLPEHAFIQVNGTLPFGGLKVDYAVYAGNSETRYIAGRAQGDLPPATDTTTSKMVGGRVGIRWSGIKAGVSMTSDRQPLLKDGVDFQNPTRKRLGGDFSASYYGVTVDAEYVKVSYDLTAAQEFMMSAIAAVDPTVGTGTTKSFYYGNVMYDISDQYFAYGGYSYLDDKSNNTLASGLRATTVGAGFRATDNVVIKGQYVKYEIKDATQVQVGPSTFLPLIALDLNVYVVAVSVFF